MRGPKPEFQPVFSDQQRQQLEARIEELDRISLSQAEIDNIVSDSMQFLSGLEFTLHQGLPQEKLVALRQCIEKVLINKPSGIVRLTVRSVPVGNLEGTVEREVSYQRTKEVDAEVIEPEIIV